MDFQQVFKHTAPLIGMVHLKPLPESPDYNGSIQAIYEQALADAKALDNAGIDALIVENFGDEPYLIGEPTSSQLAIMAAITREIQQSVSIPVGVNVQFNAWQSEIAIAHTCGAQFIRVEVFVDNVMSAQGTVPACSAQLTRLRKQLGATDVMLVADIQTKYTQNLIPQSLAQSAVDAQTAGADALIITGAATGKATPLDDIPAIKKVVELPILVGSGANPDTIRDILAVADGAIIGSALKVDGNVWNPVSLERTQKLVQAARQS